MITLLNYDNINKEEWMSLVEKSSTASPFQTPEYYDFCQTIYIWSCGCKQTQDVMPRSLKP